MIWSRASKFQPGVNQLRTQLAAEQEAHARTVDKLTAEVTHSGMLHRDLVELRESVENGDLVKRMAERLHQFTQQSVNSDLAVNEAMADHAKHYACKRRPEPQPDPAPVAANATRPAPTAAHGIL